MCFFFLAKTIKNLVNKDINRKKIVICLWYTGNDRMAVAKMGINKNRLNSVGNDSVGDDVSFRMYNDMYS